MLLSQVVCSHPCYLVSVVAFVELISHAYDMDYWIVGLLWIIGLLVIKLQLNEPPGWMWNCLVYVEWLLRAISMVLLKECTCGLPPRNKEMMKSF